jgi:hypothetical protein
MRLAPPFIAAAENIHIRRWHHHRAAVTSIHVTHASRQGRQHRKAKSNLDSVHRTLSLVLFDLHLP